jgi:transcriptional regulator with XRE-family HTH domain
MDEHEFKNYESFSMFLGVNVNTLKCWISGKRNPTIKSIDKIADALRIPSYYLLIKDVDFNCSQSEREFYLPNDTRKIISSNLKDLFIRKNRITWNDKSSLFYGYFSIDTLMSYTRNKNYRTPPLNKISLMAEYLGIEPYRLLKKGDSK